MANPSTGWFKDNPDHLLAIGACVVIIGAAVFVGARARTSAREMEQKRAGWEQTADGLTTVQQQFRAPNGTESAALISEGSRLNTLAVSREDKLNLVDAVGRLAESAGLTGVQVGATPGSDSLFAAERSVSGVGIRKADYGVTVDFNGGFAAAVRFVNTLPPSVTVSRFYGARTAQGAQYKVILSVYELDAKPAQ